MPLFGPPDIAKLQAKRDVAALIKLLQHKDAALRARAAKALGALRASEAVTPLIAALTDPDRDAVRPAARDALAAIGAPAVAPLLAALGPPMAPEQRAQLEALMGPEDSTANPPAASMSAALRRYRAIVAALAAIGAPAVAPMCALAADAHDGNRATAATALAGVLAGPLDATARAQAEQALCGALRDPNRSVRQIAAEALPPERVPGDPLLRAWHAVERQDWASAVAIGAPAIEPLARAIEDPWLSAGAAGALVALGAPAVPALLTILRGDENWMRRNVVEALGRAGRPDDEELRAWHAVAQQDWTLARECGEAALEPLAAALRSPDAQACAEAAKVLAELDDYRALALLVDALRDNPRWEVRQGAAAALGRTGDPFAVEPLCAALGDESFWVREAAAAALGELGYIEAVDVLIDALEREPEAGDAIARALGALGDRRAVPALAGALRRGSVAAAETLGRMGDPRAAWPLIEALQGGTDVREAAAAALAALPALREDEALRREAVSALIDALRWGSAASGKALEQLGVPEDNEELQARYALARRDWGQLERLGGAALDVLLDAVGCGHIETRRPAAEILARLYRSGQLDAEQRQRILAVEGEMATPHSDVYDSRCSIHSDAGIGVEL